MAMKTQLREGPYQQQADKGITSNNMDQDLNQNDIISKTICSSTIQKPLLLCFGSVLIDECHNS